MVEKERKLTLHTFCLYNLVGLYLPIILLSGGQKYSKINLYVFYMDYTIKYSNLHNFINSLTTRVNFNIKRQ